MNYVAVCIPSIGRSGQMLDDLIKVCLNERRVVYVGVYDNSADGECHIDYAFRRPGWTIYEEFNEFGSEWNFRAHMAFLNDDIVMAPGTLDAFANELDGSMDLGVISVDRDNENVKCRPRRVRRTHGTVRLGGMNSWAFMVKRNCWPGEGIDERFKVWYGDDDLLHKIERLGKAVGVLEGVSAKHEWSMTLNTIPDVGSLQAADSRLWQSLGRP